MAEELHVISTWHYKAHKASAIVV